MPPRPITHTRTARTPSAWLNRHLYLWLVRLSGQVRAFFRHSKGLFKRRSYDELIDTCLSEELKGDVRYLISYQMSACREDP
jgi:hypothetical protein